LREIRFGITFVLMPVERSMKRTQRILRTTALALVLVGSAFAQEARDYKWRSDIYNHGWKIGSIGSMPTERPMRLAPTKWVTIRVDHVGQIDNLDQGDALGKNRADFFAMIWVNGQVYKSRNFSRDEGDPHWVLRVPVSSDTSTIRIKLMDDDGGLEKRDDHVDINPAGGAKDLILTFDAATGRITGDTEGTAGSWITSSGGGDDDRGRITFSIS
jgi:hypothetical protein